jgi:hypothetical protein
MQHPRAIPLCRSVGHALWRRSAAAAVLLVGMLTVAAPASGTPPRAIASGAAGDPHAGRRAPAGKPRRLEVPSCATIDAIDAATTPEELHRSGHCEEQNGHLVAALDSYETALRRHPVAKLTRQLQARVGAVVARLGAVRIDASAWPMGSRVRAGTRVIAGERAWVDPGRVAIVVDAPGFEPSTQLVDVAPGEEKEVAIPAPRPLAAAASQPSDAAAIGPPAPLTTTLSDRRAAVAPGEESILRPLGFVGLAIGGAALVAGGVTGYLALDRGSVVRSECPTPRSCSVRGEAAARAGASFSTASNVAIASGVVVALGSLALVLLGAPKQRSVAVADFVLLGGM